MICKHRWSPEDALGFMIGTIRERNETKMPRVTGDSMKLKRKAKQDYVNYEKSFHNNKSF